MDNDRAPENPRKPETDRRAMLLAALRTGGIAATPALVTLLDPNRAEADLVSGAPPECDLFAEDCVPPD